MKKIVIGIAQKFLDMKKFNFHSSNFFAKAKRTDLSLDEILLFKDDWQR